MMNTDTSSAHQKMELMNRIEDAGGALPILIQNRYVFNSQEVDTAWERHNLCYDKNKDEFYVKVYIKKHFTYNNVPVFADGQTKKFLDVYIEWKLI